MTDDGKDDRPLQHLFENNRKWAQALLDSNPDFFNKLAAQQAPEYLWIGCSDSRVPANELLGLLPGDVFVHRNIANVIVYSDLNCLSVLQFAIQLLKVKHIIVCGHYGCSGVSAALTGQRVGIADNWLRHVQDIHQKHGAYLRHVMPERARIDRLCELNVIEQVSNVSRTTIVQDAWERGQALSIHSWIYDVRDGLLRDLSLTLTGPDDLAAKLPATMERYRATAGGDASA